ncbi:SDR family oxidoreductase (plasmid) [Georgenia sp. TF02-10]|uniref:SDR family NAD(P)-dependent oxidoreductase n=1 Tax=Georgenia sp. TF02-10 TaxID=2917725 RepID=UPI001FA7071F|nr:SDR family NAD(P)-dependent oxidoreductase [Georgenia sp. TF02-10]UNX56604.1 SDR family oxidoreductase [Georgenia sp. TF02-10]
MSGRLADRRVLVTGALGGIGAALTDRLLAEGACVLGVDRPEAVAARGADCPAGLTLAGVDLLDPSAPAAVSTLCRDELGGLDGLVNNAGIEHRAPLGEQHDDDWTRVLSVNLDAPFRLSRDLADALTRSGTGVIVNICSIAVVGFAGQAAYDASKGGLLTLTRSLAVELGPRGVRANAVCPGFIDTPMLDQGSLRSIAERVARGLPLRRLGTPADVAAAVAWLLSDESAYVTGQSLFIDGGMNRQ